MDLEKKIVIPGGAGLVGQNLVAHLERRGYRRIVVLDKHRANLAILKRLHPGVEAVDADLAEAGAWAQHFIGAGTVVILHAQIGDLESDTFVRNNVTATLRVLEAIKQSGTPFVIHVSSSVVESVVDDFYTESKKAQERLVLESGLDCVVMRPP